MSGEPFHRRIKPIRAAAPTSRTPAVDMTRNDLVGLSWPERAVLERDRRTLWGPLTADTRKDEELPSDVRTSG
jgi:hypothetical protein